MTVRNCLLALASQKQGRRLGHFAFASLHPSRGKHLSNRVTRGEGHVTCFVMGGSLSPLAGARTVVLKQHGKSWEAGRSYFLSWPGEC